MIPSYWDATTLTREAEPAADPRLRRLVTHAGPFPTLDVAPLPDAISKALSTCS
jgi:hypothetical protein